MEIYTIVTGYLETNCYVAVGNSGAEAVVIDPGANSDRIVEFVKKRDLNVKKVLLTHGHNDHIGGLTGLLHSFDVL